ncbi:hypothetical protein [Clostridium sp.]|uniref:hypothetical protein n=1 Tax=Clostridium sp. TaxID=1506 RepID=UPI00284D1588|nr:hypothetical protein [Clostridium sp.]MDR3598834.1 hypothetical protein [Clostridium sp.]
MKNLNIKELKNKGYKGFIRIGSLKNNYSILPELSGVYLILIPKDFIVKFLKDGTTNSGDSINYLQNNWVKGAKILYIGSSNNLRKHVKQLVDSRNNSVDRFPGGRHLWKLKDSLDLLISWNVIDTNECKQEKKYLLNEFMVRYSKPPFANCQVITKSEEKGQDDTINMISKNIRPNIFNMQVTIKSLESYLNRKGLLAENINEFNEQVFKEKTDLLNEIEIHSEPETANNAMQRLNSYLRNIEGLLTKTTKNVFLDMDIEDFDFYDLKPMLTDFIKNKKNEYGNEYKFILKCADTDCYIHKPTFLGMLDQLILNSHMHAFKGNNYKRKIIEIEIIDDYTNGDLIIKYSNNGSKFELTEEEFFKLGFKGTHSLGLGLGGNYIKRVVEKHHGILKIIPKNRGTEFIITLQYRYLLGGWSK